MSMRAGGRFQLSISTGSTDDETLNRAKLSKPYGYIVKPYTQAQLRATIELALVPTVRTEACQASAFAGVLDKHLLGTSRPHRRLHITMRHGKARRVRSE